MNLRLGQTHPAPGIPYWAGFTLQRLSLIPQEQNRMNALCKQAGPTKEWGGSGCLGPRVREGKTDDSNVMLLGFLSSGGQKYALSILY